MILLFKVNKGGVGKSWLTFNVGHGLALFGFKVLIITSDSQNNVLDFAASNIEHGKGLEDWVQKGEGDIIALRKNLHYIPLQSNNFSQTFREKLKKRILELKNQYDYILIDSVPVMQIDKEFEEISNKIIIPAYMDNVSVKGIIKLIDSIIDKNKILAIVPNRFNNSKSENQCYQDLKLILEGNKIFLSKPIPQRAFVTQLIEKHKSIWETENKKIEEIALIVQKLIEVIING